MSTTQTETDEAQAYEAGRIDGADWIGVYGGYGATTTVNYLDVRESARMWRRLAKVQGLIADDEHNMSDLENAYIKGFRAELGDA